MSLASVVLMIWSLVECVSTDQSGRMVAGDPAKDEDFLKNVRERAEDQRRRYEQQQRAEKAREQQERDERKRDKSPE